MIYIFDGSFEGLMTAVFEAYKKRDFEAELISDKFSQQTAFFRKQYVETDVQKAERVWNGCINKISKAFSREIYFIYLSETMYSPTVIFKYIVDAFKYGPKVYEYIHLPCVQEALKLKDKVIKENHRFKGLIRFRKYKSFYISDIRPDHNILPILYRHFEARLPNQQWIIRDIGRKIAAIHLDVETQLAQFDDSEINVDFSDEYEDIWREFYKSIAIKERKNPRLQKQFMPKRYWENLIEKM